MKKCIKNLLVDYALSTTVHSVHVSCVDRYNERLDQSVRTLIIKILKPKTRQHVYLKQSDLL